MSAFMAGKDLSVYRRAPSLHLRCTRILISSSSTKKLAAQGRDKHKLHRVLEETQAKWCEAQRLFIGSIHKNQETLVKPDNQLDKVLHCVGLGVLSDVEGVLGSVR